jgi:tetratricopeptide (TPR) repeat protein
MTASRLITITALAALAAAEQPIGAEEAAASKDPAIDEAVAHFKKGVAFFNEEDYGAALVEFLKSYELHANWALRYNIGICYMETGKIVEALDAFTAYLEEGKEGVPAARRSEVASLIEEIEAKIGRVDIACSEDGAAVFVDDFIESTTPLEKPVTLTAGIHTIVVKKPGFEPFRKEFTLVGGETRTLTIELEAVAAAQPPAAQPPVEAAATDAGGGPSPVDQPPPKTVKPKRWLWAGLGSGAALAAAAAVTGGLALKKRNDMRDAAGACDATMTRSDCPDAYAYRDEARSLVIATNVLWGVAGAAALTGLVLFIVDKPKPAGEGSGSPAPPKTSKNGRAPIVIAPMLPGAGPAGAGFQALFRF